MSAHSQRKAAYLPAIDTFWYAGEADFNEGEHRSVGHIDQGVNKADVHCSCFIWVVPVHLTPTKARKKDLDLLEPKLVLSIAWSADTQQFIYRCLDYARASDIKSDSLVSTNDLTMDALIDCLGGEHELVKTSRISYVAGCRIEDFAVVAQLEANAVTFPPLFPRQPYTRVDVEMDHKMEHPSGHWLATGMAFQFCTPTCKKGRMYTPHVDEMRWCSGICQRWYHADCLGAPHVMECVFEPDPKTADFSKDWKRWYGLTHLRIARTPRASGKYSAARVPFSLEKVLTLLREQGTAFSRLTDEGLPSFGEAVEQVVANEQWPTNLRKNLIKDIFKAVDSLARQKIYRCAGPVCGAWI